MSGSGARLDEETLGGATAGQAAADEPRREDARVVHHQEVTRDQQRRKLAERMVRHRTIHQVQPQESRCTALGRGLLGDEFRRQVEVEIRDAHASEVDQLGS